MKIAKRIQNVSPSLTLAITSQAKALQQQGESVINFAGGEPDFDTPEYIKKAAVAAIKAGFTKYTPATGYLELKQVIARKLAQDNLLNYTPAQIVVSCGAKHTIYNIIQALCEKDDEVIIFAPYWVSYPQMVELAGARLKVIETSAERGFKPDKKALASSITKKTKLLILNSPANPCGSVYSRQELKQIAQIATKHKLYVVCDEIYEKLIFDKKKHVSYASLSEQTFKQSIVVNGLSKAFAMTGWRIGYLACANERIVQAIAKLQSHSTSNPCSISQKAATAALKHVKKNQIRKIVKEFQSRRDCMVAGLEKIAGLVPVKPEGAFYVFCRIAETGLNSIDFSRRLLEEVKVAVIPGEAFGRDDYVRLSFATSKKQIEEGIRRIKKWADGLHHS
ncbi:MAG: pyridoxal phosphate-dependent aminotransferase [Candidatus Omnitrophica bacterium]|nr:pyridoxal phosphate-dependent aminotransferase [Candidatus Omnitrophota bacterium]